MSLNKINYINRYNKENYKMYQFRVKKSNLKMIKKLDEIDNKNLYITNLIAEDLESNVLTIKQIKERIKPVMQKFNIKEVYLFGSYSRGEADNNSDVDIYCESGDLKTLYDEVELKKLLEKSLGKKVDIVTIGSQMNDFFKAQLEEDKIRLWWLLKILVFF